MQPIVTCSGKIYQQDAILNEFLLLGNIPEVTALIATDLIAAFNT